MGDYSSAAPYIHFVHYLIEKCLIMRLSKEESMEALSKHANISPIITCTVWNELQKENKEFFEAYNSHFQSREREILPEKETNQILRKLISDSPGNSDHDT
ncbi:uncharacterized protein LOC21408126 [Morus notabilis]|uniref:uncharacterized protein LOC21408126 n=1 Tax=Morus notabilis TaxID=981085 RepID=UPI000CECF1ED|nr:uncharacterized protein LOC21408126 [Morus notabilis]